MQGVAGGSGRQRKRATISEESEDENRKGTGMSPYNAIIIAIPSPMPSSKAPRNLPKVQRNVSKRL